MTSVDADDRTTLSTNTVSIDDVKVGDDGILYLTNPQNIYTNQPDVMAQSTIDQHPTVQHIRPKLIGIETILPNREPTNMTKSKSIKKTDNKRQKVIPKSEHPKDKKNPTVKDILQRVTSRRSKVVEKFADKYSQERSQYIDADIVVIEKEQPTIMDVLTVPIHDHDYPPPTSTLTLSSLLNDHIEMSTFCSKPTHNANPFQENVMQVPPVMPVSNACATFEEPPIQQRHITPPTSAQINSPFVDVTQDLEQKLPTIPPTSALNMLKPIHYTDVTTTMFPNATLQELPNMTPTCAPKTIDSTHVTATTFDEPPLQDITELRPKRNRRISAKLKETVGKGNKKKIMSNVCYICNKKYKKDDDNKNTWVGCENEKVCHGWAHYKCIGWEPFLNEDVTDKTHVCFNCKH